MRVIITPDEDMAFDLFPTDEMKELVQAVLCVLKTTRGSCPGLRGFGMDPYILHKPIPVAKAAYSVSLTKQLQEYVPGVTLVRLEFKDNPIHPDTLSPILEVTIP